MKPRSLHQSPEQYILRVRDLNSSNDSEWTHIWDSSQPYGHGYPLQWILEKTSTGFRVRELQNSRSQKNRVIETRGAQSEIQLDHTTLSLSPRTFLDSAIQTSSSTSDKSQCIQAISVHCGLLTASSIIQEKFTAHTQEQETLFTIRRQPDSSITIQSHRDHVFLCRDKETKKEISKKTTLKLSLEELLKSSLQFQNNEWYFQNSEITSIPEITESISSEQATLKKSLKGSLSSVIALLIAVQLIPEQEVEEKDVIPAQYAKILMNPSGNNMPQEVAKGIDSGTQGSPKPHPSTESRVIRQQAFQSSMNKLLQGGLSKVLSQSHLVHQTQNGNPSFRTKGNSKARSLQSNLSRLTQISKTSIASTGIGKGGSGTGVGYQKGKRAGISGQGQSFIALDTGSSDVQQGLTKDEVGRVIHKHMNEIRYCYESAILKTPELQGKLSVRFTINPKGRVKSARAAESTLGSPSLDQCILRKLVTWPFPQPKGGVNVTVSYPFIFKTLGN